MTATRDCGAIVRRRRHVHHGSPGVSALVRALAALDRPRAAELAVLGHHDRLGGLRRRLGARVAHLPGHVVGQGALRARPPVRPSGRRAVRPSSLRASSNTAARFLKGARERSTAGVRRACAARAAIAVGLGTFGGWAPRSRPCATDPPWRAMTMAGRAPATTTLPQPRPSPNPPAASRACVTLSRARACACHLVHHLCRSTRTRRPTGR